MSVPNIEEFLIRTGLIVDQNMVFLLLEDPTLSNEDVPHSGIAIWQRNADWHRSHINYNGISASVIPGDAGVNRRLIIIGDNGKFTEMSGGSASEGVIKEEGSFASSCFVQGSVFAVGILGRIYRMDGADSWSDQSNELIQTNIEAICEYSQEGFLVCGWQGLVALYQGSNVERLESGTNVILTDIICDEQGEIYACGQRGVILCGRKNSLKPLKIEGITDDFWSIVKFKGEVYVASTVALYKLIDDETLELTKFYGEVIPSSFYHLQTFEDSLMLSTGQKDAVLYDGEDWIRVL